MKELLQKAIDAIYEYGKASAGMPSLSRVTYEAPVPEETEGREVILNPTPLKL
ncbi:MAG: hypothetical protein ACLR4A_07515 [Christensenellales bacterium]